MGFGWLMIWPFPADCAGIVNLDVSGFLLVKLWCV